MIKLSDYVIDFINRLGVKHIFILPGGGCMHLADSVGKNDNIEYICNLHEQACAISADAYSQYTNHLGAALVTTGPGGTNAITGVAGSWLDSIPVMIISGQVKRSDMVGDRGIRQMGFQEIGIVNLVAPITKYAVTVQKPDEIRYHLEKGAFLARTGRPGPVWIDIPLDVQSALIDENHLTQFHSESHKDETQNDALTLNDTIDDIIDLLNHSERPAILAGNGVRLSCALNELRQVIDLLNIPVLTTWKTIDIISEDDPLFAGRPGSAGQRNANFVQQNSDFIIIIGARLDHGQTGYDHKNFARSAKKIMIDIDPSEIEKMDQTIDIKLPFDAKIFLKQFLEKKGQIIRKDRSSWLKICSGWKKKYPVVLASYFKEKKVNNYVLIDALSKVMEKDDLLVPGSSGASSEVTMQTFKVKYGQRIFNSQGLGAMGFGIAAAIGGCIASGLKRTICIEGDGGFYMNVQELETVRRLNLPIIFFLLNNQGYASIRITQTNYFNGRFVGSDAKSGLTLPETQKIARGFGLNYFQINSNVNIEDKVKQVLDTKGPVLCEVVLAFDHITAPKLSSYQKKDGSMASRPLEDLAPFLPREELKENMMIPLLDEE